MGIPVLPQCTRKDFHRCTKLHLKCLLFLYQNCFIIISQVEDGFHVHQKIVVDGMALLSTVDLMGSVLVTR